MPEEWNGSGIYVRETPALVKGEDSITSTLKCISIQQHRFGRGGQRRAHPKATVHQTAVRYNPIWGSSRPTPRGGFCSTKSESCSIPVCAPYEQVSTGCRSWATVSVGCPVWQTCRMGDR